jgi:hypothetical protein
MGKEILVQLPCGCLVEVGLIETWLTRRTHEASYDRQDVIPPVKKASATMPCCGAIRPLSLDKDEPCPNCGAV